MKKMKEFDGQHVLNQFVAHKQFILTGRLYVSQFNIMIPDKLWRGRTAMEGDSKEELPLLSIAHERNLPKPTDDSNRFLFP